MKKQIAAKLTVFIITILVLLLILNSFLQFNSVSQTQKNTALSTIEQIEEILVTNDIALETLTESLKEEYIVKVQMVAYIWENINISTAEEYLELAALVNVDEIHVFDETGTIYEGSEPKYYGYSFDSGEQMSFFEPLLDDQSLTLCQDITPNTAEEKPMMYVASWTSDGSAIIQIGLEPERILEEQSQNELSYIFANMPTNDNTILFAIDSATDTIVGSSEDIFLNQTSSDIGLDINESHLDGDGFYAEINDLDYYCIFVTYEEDTYIGVAINKTVIVDEVISGMKTIAFYFTLAALLLLILLLKLIDYTILKDIDTLIENVSKIAGGDLDTKVNITSSPELKKLSFHLNMMVSSLLNNTARMSHVLDYVDTPIAVYEYKKDMRRVFATRKLHELLNVSDEELKQLLEDKYSFESKIKSIKKVTTDEANVYLLDNGSFLMIESTANNDGRYGVIVDVSDTINEKKLLEHERDYDILTEVYNRRAFYREMDHLFTEFDELKEAVIIAFDVDNLKEINDNYGHDGGDAAIKLSAAIMKSCSAPNKLISRMGGDEFIVVIYGEDNQETLMHYIDAFQYEYSRSHISSEFDNAHVKMSAGYIFCSASSMDSDYEKLLKKADEALYIAKGNGKNQFIKAAD